MWAFDNTYTTATTKCPPDSVDSPLLEKVKAQSSQEVKDVVQGKRTLPDMGIVH